MKFVENDNASRISNFLNRVDCGSCLITGTIQVYTSKLQNSQKSFSYKEGLHGASPPDSIGTDCIGLRTLDYLLHCLHLVLDQDYDLFNSIDWSQARNVDSFWRRISLDEVFCDLQVKLQHTAKVWQEQFQSNLYEQIESIITQYVEQSNFETYCCVFDQMAEKLGIQGILWSFAYFFYNKRLKKMVVFCCRATSKSALQDTQTYSENQVNEANDTVSLEDEMEYSIYDDGMILGQMDQVDYPKNLNLIYEQLQQSLPYSQGSF